MSVIPLSVPDESPASGDTEHGTTAQHVRGSSLLLVGKVGGMALDFVAQVLLVRYLSKGDYGALHWALAFVGLLQAVALFGMPLTVGRFVPLYRERKQYSTMFGSIVLAFGVVGGLGVLLALLLSVALTWFGWRPTNDAQAVQVLVILALLVPLQGIDGVWTSLFAAFGSSRAILLRQAILAPCLKLGLVLMMVVLKAPLLLFAIGYLVVSALGVLLYAAMWARLMRNQGWSRRHLPALHYPVRDIFGFALPALASTLVWLLIETSDVLLLQYFHNTEAVANFRTVLPIAQLSQVITLAFTTLYTPLAATLYARADTQAIEKLYRQTALWMTILAFPIFICTFSFAQSTTVWLYGPRYADSALVMLLLSFSYFFHTSLGFNGLTLKVFKHMRYGVLIDVTAAVLNLSINLVLVPRGGVLGAAVGTAGTLIIHNLLKQWGLWRYTGIKLFHHGNMATYAAVYSVPLALLGLQALVPMPMWVLLPLAGAASLVLFWWNRNTLQVTTMFPEVRRWPLLRALTQPIGPKA